MQTGSKFLLILAIGLLLPSLSFAAHAYALFDTPKYAADFTHFDYVNPDAPKQGTLYLANPDRRTSFDKFNPFSLKGVAAAGIDSLMIESLAVSSADEIATMYGLLADDIRLAPDRQSITFHLNLAARFNNGEAVLAQDVKHSFDTLLTKGAPQYKQLFGDIAGCIVLDAQTVRFNFKNANRELPLIVGGMPVFSRKWDAHTSFERLQFETPIGSGPYLIERYQSGHSIQYRRNPDYWGKNLAVRRGQYNFERIVYRFYKDDVARLEAFKAGEFDAIVEYSAKNWMRNYQGPAFNDGKILKTTLTHANGAGMQGFVMNLRRPQFADVRVRQALALALDFEWLNRQLFYGQYRRLNSFFTNSELAAQGLPSPEELRLLKPLQGMLDPLVYKNLLAPPPLPPTTLPPSSLRQNLRRAQQLLAQAGWTYRDGALRNARGAPFTFEILEDQPALSRVISVYARNLAKLGIQAKQRQVDFALLQKRLDEFDFDMTTLRLPDTESPGAEFFDRFGSRAADEKGSSNYWGLKNPSVDRLLPALVQANTRAELIAAARALDRVLLQLEIVIPHWYSPTHRIAYRARLARPATLPRYYQADPYVISCWWEVKPR